MKTEYAYDPELPYVIESKDDGSLIARFAEVNTANNVARLDFSFNVIDTTPKPKIPADAEFILISGEEYVADVYKKIQDAAEPSGYYWYRILDSTSYANEEMPELIGADEVTVLVPKETS